MATLGDIGVSAFINILGALAFMLAFALLRIQPINDRVYFQNVTLLGRGLALAAGADWCANLSISTSRLISLFFNWMPQALKMSESEIISHAGLNSGVFLRIYTLGLKIFGPIAIAALLVLIPVNVSDGTLFFLRSELVINDIHELSISNEHLFTFWARYMLYKEDDRVASMRLNFLASQGSLQNISRNVPKISGRAISDSAETFFQRNHPDQYLCRQRGSLDFEAKELIQLTATKNKLNSLLKKFLKAHVNFRSPGAEGCGEVKETYASRNSTLSHPSWYSSETGIYRSKYTPIDLLSDPFLDVTSFIFSQEHDGVHALIDSSSGLSVSYSKLFLLVKSVASGLHRMAVKQGDAILLLLPNSVYFPIIFLGALSIGAIVTPMNPLSSLLEIKRQVLDSNASLVFSLLDKVDQLVNGLGGCRVIGVPEILNFNSLPNDGSLFHKLISSDPGVAPRPKIMQQDIAAILYSSGTTGRAKGVMLTHGNFIAMMELFVRFEASLYDYPSTETVYLAIVPMFHVYGLSLFVMGLLSLGCTIVTMKRFDADEMVRAIGRYGVTHIHVVPPILKALTEKAKTVAPNIFRSLKQVSCGAAPLSEQCINEFLVTLRHVDFIQGYGMTESTAVGTRGYNTVNNHKYSSVGLLSPNVEAKVVDWVTGSCLPPGSIGELWLRTRGTMKGYLNDMEATMAVIDKDGWLHTGDIVYFDVEGYLYVIDRLKEMIKYKGFQIAPGDLEAVLISHPEVLDAAVAGARDEEAGEIPVAFVVLKDGSSVSQTALMEYVAKQVAPYKKVRKVYFRASIPRSASGKTLRREIRSLLAASSL